MAGIYIHIPFCKQACHYCDFHFSVNQNRKSAMVEAIVSEIKLQKHYLGSEVISTVYFGGGTPSLLSELELDQILKEINHQFTLEEDTEITLEANPDDLTYSKLRMLTQLGINRLSIGIQSFNDTSLKYLNRAHNSNEAVKCIEDARKAGFDNLSIDLIYAIPSDDHRLWESDLSRVVALAPNHISSYCLTVEPQTVFGRKLKKGELKVASDDFAAHQFELLVGTLTDNGYAQYEVSNFCKAGFHSKHNSNYWRQEKYIGIGPSAHSYNGLSRQFNVNHNQKYLQSISKGVIPFELETLSRIDLINEYILTTLRTSWGTSLEYLSSLHAYDLLSDQNTYISTLIEKGFAIIENKHIKLTLSGKLLADKISSDLFLTSD